MLCHEVPGDWVLASGTDRSVEDFVSAAFKAVDLDWRDWVRQSPSLYRKNELTCLQGDASRAKTELDWSPELSFEGLVERMIRSDLERLA